MIVTNAKEQGRSMVENLQALQYIKQACAMVDTRGECDSEVWEVWESKSLLVVIDNDYSKRSLLSKRSEYKEFNRRSLLAPSFAPGARSRAERASTISKGQNDKG